MQSIGGRLLPLRLAPVHVDAYILALILLDQVNRHVQRSHFRQALTGPDPTAWSSPARPSRQGSPQAWSGRPAAEPQQANRLLPGAEHARSAPGSSAPQTPEPPAHQPSRRLGGLGNSESWLPVQSQGRASGERHRLSLTSHAHPGQEPGEQQSCSASAAASGTAEAAAPLTLPLAACQADLSSSSCPGAGEPALCCQSLTSIQGW